MHFLREKEHKIPIMSATQIDPCNVSHQPDVVGNSIRNKKKYKRTGPRGKIYQVMVKTDSFSYNVKFSDEGQNIAVSIPNACCLIDKTTKILDEDFQMTLKIMGWSDIAITSLMNKVLFPASGKWKTCSTIHFQTGQVVDAY